jgi:hypothetical protein
VASELFGIMPRLLEGSNSDLVVVVVFCKALLNSAPENCASRPQFHRFPRIQSSLHMYITATFLIAVTFSCVCVVNGTPPGSHSIERLLSPWPALDLVVFRLLRINRPITLLRHGSEGLECDISNMSDVVKQACCNRNESLVYYTSSTWGK